MDRFQETKETLLAASRELLSLLAAAETIPGAANGGFGQWSATCRRIEKQISEDVLRIAVVGAIKSGKSTFINALFGADHLKRGAGVVTSIVTRIRRADALGATLHFKSWDEVNAEVESAMVLFPSLSWRSGQGRFDIRNPQDRADLQQALKLLDTDRLITNDTRNANSVLLMSFLAGYDRVAERLSEDTGSGRQDEIAFDEHRRFVGDDGLAVYLKDIRLEIDGGSLSDAIEIADCQGSDSPNPLHLAMIQDYLFQTHLIIYVVSSRTGLRQADIKFLTMIREMGILDNTLFVVNVDLSEHDTLADLQRLLNRLQQELSLLRPDPEIFALSSLFNLFSSALFTATENDRQRLAHWRAQTEMVAFTKSETLRFLSSLEGRLIGQRFGLLVSNHLQRLGIIAGGIQDWIGLNRDLLSRNQEELHRIVAHISRHQGGLDPIRSMIRSTLDGAVIQIRQDLKRQVDRFFDQGIGDLFSGLTNFVASWRVSYEKYQEDFGKNGFANTLYMVFQEFKQAIDTYMAETVNPRVIRFVKSQEQAIIAGFEIVGEPYEKMASKALTEYDQSLETLGIHRSYRQLPALRLPGIDSVKDSIGLSLPPAVAALRYSARIKTEAVMRLGLYRIVKKIRQWVKKAAPGSLEDVTQALSASVSRMKRETRDSIRFHFKDYQENLKFQYLFKLLDAVSDTLFHALLERFETQVTDLAHIAGHIAQHQADRQQTLSVIEQMANDLQRVQDQIRSMS